MGFATSILLLLYPLSARGLPHFPQELPNGSRVPNPRPQGGIWAGVGHAEAAGGGGPLNPFGKDFRKQGYKWTEELCLADSDGDGRSNGMELGDPNCRWTKGDPDPVLPALSHPGIVDTPKHEDEIYKEPCADYQEPDNKIELEIKFTSRVEIDETRTHYMCEQIEVPVPSASKLHQVKRSILLDNARILHHAFLYLCPQGQSVVDGNRVGQGPYQCQGSESSCIQMAAFALGPDIDDCMPPNVGEEYDFTGQETAVMKIEAHYDNTLLTPQVDQSGFRVTFTPDLRPLPMGLAVLGFGNEDVNLAIPPQQEKYAIQNVCPSEATSKLEAPLYVMAFYPHMHLYGRNLYTEQYRCGKKIGEMGHIQSYEFNNQQKYDLSHKYIKILPGDAFVTTCEYNTMTTNVSLSGGDNTEDEMCFNFLFYYPAPSKPGLLQPCLGFENGVVMDKLQGGPFDTAEGIPDFIKPIVQDRFAVFNRNPVGGILTDYSSDPKASWAPCCDTGTCDIDFLASEGEPCAQDSDCLDFLTCSQGLCEGGASVNTPSTEFDMGVSSSRQGETLTALVTCMAVAAAALAFN